MSRPNAKKPPGKSSMWPPTTASFRHHQPKTHGNHSHAHRRDYSYTNSPIYYDPMPPLFYHASFPPLPGSIGILPTIYGPPPLGAFIIPSPPSTSPPKFYPAFTFPTAHKTDDGQSARNRPRESRSYPWRRFVQIEKASPEAGESAFGSSSAETTRSASLEAEASSTLATGDLEFSLMTYNVLAQCYWHDEFDASCPKYASNAKYRGENIVREVEYYKPDIVCMQEVDNFDDFYKDKMNALGYTGLFNRRQGRPDGSTLFYMTHKFVLEDMKKLNLNDIVHSSHPTVKADPYRFHRDSVAIVCILKSIETNRAICVATGHAFWNPQFEDVKLMQLHTIVNVAGKLSQDMERSTGQDVPVVIAGDFNSLPGSAVVEYVIEGRLRDDNPKKTQYSFSDEHDLKLASAYDALGNPNTNFTKKFTGCLDWIFYTARSMEVVELLDKLDEENPLFKEYNQALPNPWLSSDHVALMSKFVVRGAKLSPSTQ